MPAGKNLIVGLTGGMGCGKSTVAAMLAEHGFQRLDSDQFIRDVLYRDPAVVAALRGKFGGGVITPEGGVDRRKVAEIIFADDAALAWLEGLLHPRLYAHWEKLFAGGNGQAWVVEVPLLFEKKLENWFDFTICVSTDSAQQSRRLEQRGIQPRLARQRLAKQLPLARKCELADFVLLNDGTLDFLREQASALAARLLQPNPAN